jgi:hypothetical protein
VQYQTVLQPGITRFLLLSTETGRVVLKYEYLKASFITQQVLVSWCLVHDKVNHFTKAVQGVRWNTLPAVTKQQHKDWGCEFG